MSKKMKQSLTFILSAAMIMSLAACGDNSPEETSGQSKTAEQSSASVQTSASSESDVPEVTYEPLGKYDEPVTITFANMLRDGTVDENGDTVTDNAILDYIKDAMNIEIEREIEAAAQTDYTTALSLAITAGEIPDVTVVYDYDQLVEMVEADLIYDLTEIVENYAGAASNTLWDSYDFDVFAKTTFDGKIMALPRISNEAGTLVWIRQDWMDTLGISVDEDGDMLITREELEMVASEFVENDPGNSGNPIGIALVCNSGNTSSYNINPVCGSFGAYPWSWIQKEDGSIVNGVTTPEMKEALAWWSEMNAKGLVDPQYGITKTADIKSMFANGQTGITFGARNLCNWFFNDTYTADENACFVTYGLDNGTGKASYRAQDSQTRYVVASKDCEHPEVAMKLYNLVTEVQSGAFDNEEIAQAYPEFHEIYCVDTGSFTTYEPLNIAISFGNVVTTRVDEVKAWQAGTLAKEDVTDSTALKYIDALEAMEAGNATPAQRICYDEYFGTKTWVELLDSGRFELQYLLNPATTEEIALYYADLKTLGEEMQIKIVTGEESVDYFDTFVEEWNKRGGQEIVDGLEDFYN